MTRDIANFNIQPIIHKCRNGEKLTQSEQKAIVEFYLEVISFISGKGVTNAKTK